jgi:hypothetical protein
MITAKEKAIELYDRFRNKNSVMTANNRSKKQALICVDEIIKTLNEDIRDLDVVGNILLDLIKYWREIKQQLIKLQ